MPVLDHTLTYDSAGNLKSIADGVPGGLESRTLSYDGRNRLTSITASPQGNESYVYDPLDNVRQTVQGGTDRRFHYAPVTQRLEWIRTPTGQNLSGYQWNDRGELNRRSQFTPGIVPVTPPTIFRSGFESPLIETRTEFAFDRASRMTGSFNGQITYLYDAHGRRVRTSQALFGSRYEVYSQGGQLLHIEDGPANLRHDYVQLGGQLVAERQQPVGGGTARVSYLHSDLLGSLSVKTANQGSVVYRSRYQAFGAPYDSWRDGPGYTKHVMDSVSQLVYMQQRYYDPATLRFISTDPVSADPLNFNRYWYANSNPYTFWDPDGRCSADTGTRICIHARTFDPARSSGMNAAGNTELDAAAMANRRSVRAAGRMDRSGRDSREKIRSINRQKDGTLKAERLGRTTTADTDTAHTAAGVPESTAEAIIHGHLGESLTDDATTVGDANPLLIIQKPNYAVSTGNRMIVHEVVDGRYQVRMISGEMTAEEQEHFQEVLDVRQELFHEGR